MRKENFGSLESTLELFSTPGGEGGDVICIVVRANAPS